ncbi:hypothetical protein [Ligilactobacillus salivarius]|uniref:hypothetical protein n=1 Tax=Ligilactobacillus salivarius TaxID=1624 RepID=UPI003D77D6B6
MYCSLLPELEELSQYIDPISYIDSLYDYYLRNIKLGLQFRGKRVTCKKYPEYEGRDDAFNHLTTKDFHDDNDREIDLRRCERLKWIKPGMMGDHQGKNCFLEYEKVVRGKKRIHLLNQYDRYMIVLEDRGDYVLLVTAYYIQYDNTLKKKVLEYHKFR